MNVLQIILIILNGAVFILLGLLLLSYLASNKEEKSRDKNRLKSFYEDENVSRAELFEVLTRHKIKYSGKFFNITEVFRVDGGAIRIRLKDERGFEKCASIKDIKIGTLIDKK